jgi:hypothetical protein
MTRAARIEIMSRAIKGVRTDWDAMILPAAIAVVPCLVV